MDTGGLDSNMPKDDFSRREMDLYPDLVRMGGLPAAMLDLCNEHALNVGELSSLPFRGQIRPALAKSRNGSVSVVAGMVERSFSIGVSRGGHLLASGTTDSLIDVVRLADAWRAGVTLRSLEALFPFMNVEPLARALEDGNEVAFSWSGLVQDPDLEEVRPLLMAAWRDRVLGKLFPSVSHLTLLRLELDPLDSASGAILIGTTADLHFSVDATWLEGAASRVESIEEALEVANILLRDRN